MKDTYTEMAVLGSAIVNQSVAYDLMHFGDELFYDAKHKHIFNSLSDLHRSGEKVDILAVRNKLCEVGAFEKIGDKYLADILQHATIINVNHAIHTLNKFSKRRRLAELSLQINDCIKNNIENDFILNQITDVINEIDRLNHTDIVDIINIFPAGDVSEAFNVEGRYIPTGFDNLDSRLIGLFRGELIILAARPGVGKTALALNISTNAAKNDNVLFISLEMGIKQLSLRMLSAYASVDSDLIRRGKVLQQEKIAIRNAVDNLSMLKLSFSENSYTLEEIISKIRKYTKQKKAGLIVVDYLQLIQVNNKNQRYVQVGEISRRLKLLTRELDIPILCLAQLSRNAELNVPKLSDLRESGDIEQDADVVLFIHKEKEESNDIVNILFAKNRSGKADHKAEMKFIKKYNRFHDVVYDLDFSNTHKQ